MENDIDIYETDLAESMAIWGLGEDEHMFLQDFFLHDHQDVRDDSVAGMPLSLRLYCGPSGWRLTRCMSETVVWGVDNVSGSLESMGSRADPPCAAPKCWNGKRPRIQRHTHPSGNGELMDSGSESILCLGMSSVSTTLAVDQSFFCLLHQCRALTA